MLTTCTRCLTRGLVSQPGALCSNIFAGGLSVTASRQPVLQLRRSNSTTPAATPKRPSPYRLIPVSTFLADFAPLHVKGWRLDTIPHARRNDRSQTPSAVTGAEPKEGGMVELQDRRLTRRYDFERGKQGWRGLLGFMQAVGDVVEAEDHHPTIRISPAVDIDSFPPIPDAIGYVLSVSTHTHTPLPPLKYPNKEESMRPGVTGKDMKLAAKLEELYEGLRSV